MSFIIGTRRFGKIKSFANQYIDTKFLVIGLPIYPLESYFVDKETQKEIPIKINIQSIFSFYLPVLTVIGVLFGLSSSMYFLIHLPKPLNIIALWSEILLGLALMVYSIFFFGSTNKKEKKMRTCIQNVLTLNALPQYLTYHQVETTYYNLVEKLEPNWESNIETRKFSGDNFFKYYTTLLFKFELEKDEKSQRLIQFMEESFVDTK